MRAECTASPLAPRQSRPRRKSRVTSDVGSTAARKSPIDDRGSENASRSVGKKARV